MEPPPASGDKAPGRIAAIVRVSSCNFVEAYDFVVYGCAVALLPAVIGAPARSARGVVLADG